MRILKEALRLCDLPCEPFVHLGNQKGVYLAWLSEESLISLKTGLNSAIDSLSVTDAVNYWKTCLLPKRAQNKQVIEQIQSLRREEILIGKTGVKETHAV
jgi:hypothetical protein